MDFVWRENWGDGEFANFITSNYTQSSWMGFHGGVLCSGASKKSGKRRRAQEEISLNINWESIKKDEKTNKFSSVLAALLLCRVEPTFFFIIKKNFEFISSAKKEGFLSFSLKDENFLTNFRQKTTFSHLHDEKMSSLSSPEKQRKIKSRPKLIIIFPLKCDQVDGWTKKIRMKYRFRFYKIIFIRFILSHSLVLAIIFGYIFASFAILLRTTSLIPMKRNNQYWTEERAQ